jgi:hypothetical protein
VKSFEVIRYFIHNESKFKKNIFISSLQITAKMSEKTNREWNEIFSSAQARFPFGPVNNLAAVFSDEQVLHNKMVVEMEHEKVGTIKQVKAKLIFMYL